MSSNVKQPEELGHPLQGFLFAGKKTSLPKIEAEYLDLHELAIKYKDKVRQHAIPICWYMFPVGGKHASETWVKKSGRQMAPTLSLQLQWLEEIHSQRQSQRFSQSPPGMFQAPATPPATAATRIMPGIIINNSTIIIVIVIIVTIVIN